MPCSCYLIAMGELARVHPVLMWPRIHRLINKFLIGLRECAVLTSCTERVLRILVKHSPMDGCMYTWYMYAYLLRAGSLLCPSQMRKVLPEQPRYARPQAYSASTGNCSLINTKGLTLSAC